MQRCSAAPNELQANKTQQNINTEQRAQRAREIKTTPPKEADDRLIEATTKLQEVGNLKAKRFGQLAPHRSSERSRSNAMAMRCTMRCNARIVNAVTEHAERERVRMRVTKGHLEIEMGPDMQGSIQPAAANMLRNGAHQSTHVRHASRACDHNDDERAIRLDSFSSGVRRGTWATGPN